MLIQKYQYFYCMYIEKHTSFDYLKIFIYKNLLKYFFKC